MESPTRLTPHEDTGVNDLPHNCDICLEHHEILNCPYLENVLSIPDAEILPKALASLPSVLKFQKVQEEDRYEIVAKEPIRLGTQFGPLEAPLLPCLDEDPDHVYKVKSSCDSTPWYYFDLTSVSDCNWMSLVPFSEDSNCICYKNQGLIYFLVTKEILIGSQLRVTYSPGYKCFMETSIHQEEQQLEAEFKHNSSLKRKGSNESDIDVTSTNSARRPKKRKFTKVQKKRRGKLRSAQVKSEFENSATSLEITVSPNKGNFNLREKLKRLGPCLALDDWKCKFCSEVFTKILDFATHLIVHYKLVGAARTEKGRELSSKNLPDSKQEQDPGQGSKSADLLAIVPTFPYSCDICERQKTFSRAEYMIRHLNKHALCIRCKECGVTVRGETHTCSEEDSREFNCSICSKNLGSDFSLKRHMKQKHGEKSSYFCSICDRKFQSPEAKDCHTCAPATKRQLRSTGLGLALKTKILETENKADEREHEGSNNNTEDGINVADFTNPGTNVTVLLFTNCAICDKEIENKQLERHQLICEAVYDFHSGSKSHLECRICDTLEECTDLEEFKTHVGHHTHPLMCPACQLRLTCRESLKRHTCADYACDGCVEVFDSFLDLRSHIKKVHGKADFYCYECAFPFITREAYLDAKRCFCWHDEKFWGKDLNMEGNSEGVVSQKRFAVKKWKSQERQGQNGNFVCEICGHHYTKFSSLKTHRITHGPRKYVCPTCGKQFHRHSLLADHLFVHVPPQFSCVECGKKFKSPKALDVHSRIHSGLKNYACDFEGCEKAFCQKGNLMAHRLTHVPLEEKDFQCPYCSKRLATRESCNLHVKAHEEKPFGCQICPKEFVNAAMLKRHMGVAHGTQRYSCAMCSLVVKQRATFLRHLRNKHPELSDIWMEEGHVESRLMAFDPRPKSPGTSRRKTIVVEVRQDFDSSDLVTETLTLESGEGDDGEAGAVDENELMNESVWKGDIEYHNEEDLILSTVDDEAQVDQSELLLLQLNHEGEFVLSLGGEEVELVDGSYLKGQSDFSSDHTLT